MVQLIDGSEALESMGRVMAAKPQAILSIRMMLGPETTDRILELSGHGLKVFHICADQHGREHMKAGAPGRHIKDMLREMHSRLVTEGVRDEITLIVSGGIALAEHMAKAILCGTDLVAADTALLAALGCRVCRHAHPSDSDGSGEAYRIASPGVCSYGIDSVDSHHAAQRIVNLMGAWHGQLIEVLGAMGIRDVRRLRGEMGRAIFMEEIEIEAFGDLLRVSPRQETV
ncbi:MAG TPA: glutamate synthase-related protein, partial [Acidobacteriota bacterium]|nr:glutamate synthase-related protein [Acidobacteriota bacterium]